MLDLLETGCTVFRIIYLMAGCPTEKSTTSRSSVSWVPVPWRLTGVRGLQRDRWEGVWRNLRYMSKARPKIKVDLSGMHDRNMIGRMDAMFRLLYHDDRR